jgi:hypothetical protein
VDHEGFGLLLNERDKILTEHLQAIIDEAVEVAIATKRQVSLENNAVRTRESAYNRISENAARSSGSSAWRSAPRLVWLTNSE